MINIKRKIMCRPQHKSEMLILQDSLSLQNCVLTSALFKYKHFIYDRTLFIFNLKLKDNRAKFKALYFVRNISHCIVKYINKVNLTYYFNDINVNKYLLTHLLQMITDLKCFILLQYKILVLVMYVAFSVYYQ